METQLGCAAKVLLVGFLWLFVSPGFAQGLSGDEHSIGVGGVARSYLLYVPPGVVRPAPLVMVFHGGGGRPAGIMRTSGMNEIADRQHFIVVYPAGLDRVGARGGGWNIGGVESRSSADDVGFVRALLTDLARSYAIDPRRIYATGESLGGVFSYRLACEMSDVFAAIAPVAATMVQTDCRPHSPVAVLHIHGTNDELIPFGGGSGLLTAAGRSWPAPGRAVDFWAQYDGCAGRESTSADGPETSCRTSGSCRAKVEYCVVAGGGHAWPGSQPLPWQQRFNVHVSQTFPASQRIWAFFAANPKAP